MKFWAASILPMTFTLIALSGCSLKSAHDAPSLHLDLSGLAQSPSRFSLLGGGSFLSAPSSLAPQNLSGFACYGVNVTGPGIADTSTHPDPNAMISFDRLVQDPSFYCSYRGVVAGPLSSSAMSDVALAVPPGPVRVVQVVGVTDPTMCAAGINGDGSSNGGGSQVYELGRAVLNDVYADVSTTINATWPSGSTFQDSLDREKRVLDCGGNCAPFYSALTPHTLSTLGLTGTSIKYALRVGAAPGQYLRRASLSLSGQSIAPASYPTVDATVTIYETTAGSSDPDTAGGSTGYSASIAIPTATSPTAQVFTFDLRDAFGHLLQMRTGYDYWIVVQSADASGSQRALQIDYDLGSVPGTSTNLFSWSGSSWTSAGSNTDASFVISAAGCTN